MTKTYESYRCDQAYNKEYLRFYLCKVLIFFSALLVGGVAVVCSEIAISYVNEYWHLIPQDPTSLLPWRDERVLFLIHPVLQIVGSIAAVICWFHISVMAYDINLDHHEYRCSQIREIRSRLRLNPAKEY
jgi:hypothetical protein